MADLDQLRHIDNLRSAWRWLRSNADASYKSYFRSLYQRFAIAEETLLDDLADRLKRGIYEPEPSTKLFHPKASGILRPYSLLSVEDPGIASSAFRHGADCVGVFEDLGQRHVSGDVNRFECKTLLRSLLQRP